MLQNFVCPLERWAFPAFQKTAVFHHSFLYLSYAVSLVHLLVSLVTHTGELDIF